jgi:hypothetical protein
MRFPRSGSIRQWSDGDYVVTTDSVEVDLDVVHRYLSAVGFEPIMRVERWMERWFRAPNP